MRPPRVQFTVRWLMVTVAAIALIIAGYLWRYRPPLVIVELARAPESVNADHDVFDVVLSDLIENKEFAPATGGRGVEKHQIVLGTTTKIGIGTGAADRLGFDPWVGAKQIPAEVKLAFMSRNPRNKRYYLAGYRPSSSNVLVRDLGQADRDFGFPSQFPDARGYVESWLPGYSRDGRIAVVCFSFGPTAHGAVGCYVLRKTNGCWEISERLIGYFS